MNIELLQKVKAHILEEPRRLNMSVGARSSDVAPCGTVGCIAEWSALLSGRITKNQLEALEKDAEFSWTHIRDMAEDELNLRGRNLFYVEDWPSEFRAAYKTANTVQERAEITARRIDYLIEKGE